MLEVYEASGASRLVILGDILYHGPRNDLPREYAPKEVIAMLNPLKNQIYAVRGNCDTEVDQMVLEFPHPGGLWPFSPSRERRSTRPMDMSITRIICRPCRRATS